MHPPIDRCNSLAMAIVLCPKSFPFSIAQLMDELSDAIQSRIAAEQKAIVVWIEIEESLPEYWIGDPLRIQQALLELMLKTIQWTARDEVVCHVTRSLDMDGRPLLSFFIHDSIEWIPSEADINLSERQTACASLKQREILPYAKVRVSS